MTARSLPARIQAALCRMYGIENAPLVDDFIRPCEGGIDREVLLVREDDDGVEVALHLPDSALAKVPTTFDELCQVIEGVSHFVFLVERARRELPLTQLELELQAEVDKYVIFVHDPHDVRPFEPDRAARIRAKLFDTVQYIDPPGTERGDRYRLANDLAARFAGMLDERFARQGRFEQLWRALRRFYSAGQYEKINLACAA
ncbi:MAG: hypothetical protein IPM54_41535 [Polyangiaceae bacterium]|nr:hypothetical protein [Polyangiaceae bacterium]